MGADFWKDECLAIESATMGFDEQSANLERAIEDARNEIRSIERRIARLEGELEARVVLRNEIEESRSQRRERTDSVAAKRVREREDKARRELREPGGG